MTASRSKILASAETKTPLLATLQPRSRPHLQLGPPEKSEQRWDGRPGQEFEIRGSTERHARDHCTHRTEKSSKRQPGRILDVALERQFPNNLPLTDQKPHTAPIDTVGRLPPSAPSPETRSTTAAGSITRLPLHRRPFHDWWPTSPTKPLQLLPLALTGHRQHSDESDHSASVKPFRQL